MKNIFGITNYWKCNSADMLKQIVSMIVVFKYEINFGSLKLRRNLLTGDNKYETVTEFEIY